jgi:YD repeat-containing protein
MTSQTYSIVGFADGVGGFVLDQKYDSNLPSPTSATLSLKDQDGKHYLIETTGGGSVPLATTITDDYNRYYDLPKTFTAYYFSVAMPVGSTALTGEITLHYSNNTNAGASSPTASHLAISNDRAHTGSKSLKMFGTNSASLTQKTLMLQNGKEYIFSAWVSEDNQRQFKFGKTSINANGTTINPSGKVIEGWQRIEGTFIAGPNNTIVINSNGGGTVYIDDIRIFPKDGAIQSYVYSPTNFRLIATLDNNNFASFYTYDAEGNLSHVRKETKDGIVTLQEARNYIAPN